MAFNLAERFPPTPKYYRILDPCTYDKNGKHFIPNRAPFLSNTARTNLDRAPLWTHAIYNVDKSYRVPNATSLVSKTPRFAYEAFKIEDFEKRLCECGIAPCECPTEPEGEIICQEKIHKRLFKGRCPEPAGGVSVPSKRHLGYQILPDGTKIKMEQEINEGPPIYDARVIEATAFYRGCKWGNWTAKPSNLIEKRPGPADYDIEIGPTVAEICNEKFRSYKRQTSRQPRYIEMIQERNLTENRPGPPHYHICDPIGTEMVYLGPKADRFPESTEKRPGPADYSVKRSFDLPEVSKPCYARLPAIAPFGVAAKRFVVKPDDRPSPASYDARYKPCKVLRCTKAPFDSSANRFTNTPLIEDNEDDESNSEESPRCRCPIPTSSFKSKTRRFSPLVLKEDEPSPADMPPINHNIKRHELLQYNAPFFSSEGRFQRWHNFIPIFAAENTPGPGALNLEKPRCPPAVYRGPLYRAPRFPSPSFDNPAPNEYQVHGGVETILKTHNKKLKSIMENQFKFNWKPPLYNKALSPEEKESMLLNQSIALLDYDSDNIIDKEKLKKVNEQNKPKMLNWFLYKHPMRRYY